MGRGSLIVPGPPAEPTEPAESPPQPGPLWQAAWDGLPTHSASSPAVQPLLQGMEVGSRAPGLLQNQNGPNPAHAWSKARPTLIWQLTPPPWFSPQPSSSFSPHPPGPSLETLPGPTWQALLICLSSNSFLYLRNLPALPFSPHRTVVLVSLCVYLILLRLP